LSIEVKVVKHGCVILADVHQPMLEATRSLLDVVFDTVVMVSSYESLLKAALNMRPDLIVVDLSLPSSSGDKLLLPLDKQLKEFVIIIIGSYNEKDVVNSIMKKGADGYVLKRSMATDLLQAIDKVLDGETYVSPSAVCE